MRKQLIIFSMALLLFLGFTMPSASAKNYAGNTHETAIDYLVKKGALKPDANGNYNVTKSVTRGEFASFLAITMVLPSDSYAKGYTDVKEGSSLSRYIAAATEAGIIKGYPDKTFRPDENISRQHMATMLKRAMDYLKITPETYSKTVFKDENLILSEHKEAVQLGAALEIIKGSTQTDGVHFMPQSNALISQSASFIQRMMNVYGDPDAKIALYEVENIVNKELVTVASYYSLEDALAAKTSNKQVITKDGKIVWMAGGTGFAVTNAYTVLTSETVNDVLAVNKDVQLQLISIDGSKAKVNLMGQIGTIDVANLDFYPFDYAKGRDYYTNRDGEIYHIFINPKTGSQTASFSIGTAPTFMQQGVNYYSWDGVNFVSANGQTGQYYNYYQHLPIHTKTAYTAEQLDQYIMQVLQGLPQNKYPNVTTTSKLVGLGTALKQIENQYHINAAVMLSIAMNESTFGTSTHAQENNNLFGLYVYDTNPLNKQFATASDSIVELVTKFFIPNYIPARYTASNVTGRYGHGAALGSKMFGINVKYASDPYWGQKAASYYYRLDKTLGKLDSNHTIGLTTQYVNVRSTPATVNGTVLFQYPRENYPVLITDTSIEDWYTTVSDANRTSTAYINKQYVKIIETTK